MHKHPFESPESHESEMMAEIIKIKIGSAVPLKKNLEVKLRSKDLTTGMPKAVTITDADVTADH